MKTKTLIAVLGMLLPLLSPKAQQITPLNIGDTVPDLLLQHIVNHTPTTGRLSDYKGKIILLDFGATWCAPCVAELPRLDSMKRAFDDRMEIFPITVEPVSTIQKQIYGKTAFRHLSLPYVSLDSSYYKAIWPLFAFRGIPHSVLLDGNRRILAITGTRNISTQAISAVLKGEKINLPLKKDLADFDYDLPLMENPMIKDVVFRSQLSHRIKGISSKQVYHIANATQPAYINYFNSDLLGFYLACLGKPLYYRVSRLWWKDVEEPDRYRNPRNRDSRMAEEWLNNYSYCYGISMQGADRWKLLDAMRRDLDGYLWRQYKGHVYADTQEVDCYLLKTLTGKLIPHSLKGADLQQAMRNNDIIFRNGNASLLAESLEACLAWIPFVTEVKDTSHTTIHIPLSVIKECTDKHIVTDALATILKTHGLYLEKSRRPVEMLVIKEEKHS